MKPEEEVLQKIKHVLSVGNESQAIRLIEQYGDFKQEESKQFSLNAVSKPVACYNCGDSDIEWYCSNCYEQALDGLPY